MQEIKFCQYCGNNELDIEVTLDRESGKIYRVHCRQCGAQGPIGVNSELAILKWNSRIQEAPEIPQERPTIIDDWDADKHCCPFDKEDCKGADCMMWVSVGEDKGRCGLVNTIYINSTGCNAV